MRYLILVVWLSGFGIIGWGQWQGNTTPDYKELIHYYRNLAANHQEVEWYDMGISDAGLPIYCCLINGAGDSLRSFQKARSATTILINNGIHPGEPDGINACHDWIEAWIKNGKPVDKLPVIAIIPVYNVGGMLNRNSSSRANQNGPEAYGFRGNAANLDLNRDFIKMDSKNAETFVRLFQALDPDVFLDTHVSNGADYTYTLTLIHSIKERLNPAMNRFMERIYFPELKQFSKQTGWEWAPYVETYKQTPDSGLVGFDDLPRYAQGYARLFHTISITVETHMLKPFPQRVKATQDYLSFMIDWTKRYSKEIEAARVQSKKESQKMQVYPYNLEMLETPDSIWFRGYEASYPISEVTGQKRLKYLREKPYYKQIPYYNRFLARDSVTIPAAYFIPVDAREIIKRLQWNGVVMQRLERDTVIIAATQRVQNFKSGSKPYEGHYLHTATVVREVTDTITVLSGGYLVPVDQERKDFVVSVMEAVMEDSYFAWNFTDSYIQEKEYFSAYVFEDVAAELLRTNPELKTEFEQMKREDAAFASDTWAQLYFIYQHSPNFETHTFNRLPIYKLYRN